LLVARAGEFLAERTFIRAIRVIRGCLPNFLRNSRPNLAQYISERLEMTSHGEKPKKAKTTKRKSSTSTKDINYAT